MIYEPWIELAKRLAAVTGQARAFRAVGGTDAVEQALQIAATSTGRHKFVSLEGAYHGNSFAAHSIGEKLDIAIPSCKHLATPLDGRALERLETLLKARDVAAFILEPISMNLGVEVPTIELMRGARQLCDRYGTLLVFDEVACGFGRTGKMFAAEHYGVLPDIVTLAKALSNGAAPIAATLTTADVADSVRGEMSFYSTFAWVPLAVEAALTVLDIWDDDRDTLLANIERRSGEFVSRLLAMPWKREVDIRVKGLAIAVEVDEAEQIVERARKRGLIIGEEDDTLQMFPPLVLNDDDAAEGLEILERAISG
jgi:acetylornithine/succinyldiaminopimelate/putrescine aminotransferase